jgi:hypothetical protein
VTIAMHCERRHSNTGPLGCRRSFAHLCAHPLVAMRGMCAIVRKLS